MTANPLGTEPVSKLILKFSIPAIISMLIIAIYNMIDQVFIGWDIGVLGIATTHTCSRSESAKTIAKRTQYAFSSFFILPQDIAFWNDFRYRYSVLAKTRPFPLVSH